MAASDEWAAQVRQAAIAGDAARLRALYANGQDLLGDAVAHAWSTVLSDLDASAITG